MKVRTGILHDKWCKIDTFASTVHWMKDKSFVLIMIMDFRLALKKCKQ